MTNWPNSNETVDKENGSDISKTRKADVIKILKYILRKYFEFYTDNVNRDVTENSVSE